MSPAENTPHIAFEPAPELGAELSRRRFLDLSLKAAVAAVGVGAIGTLEACTTSSPDKPHPVVTPSVSHDTGPTPKTPETPAEMFAEQAATSLLALGEEDLGGLRFKSQIQAPNYQADRDVGAASTGMGFLVMADKDPSDSRWLEAATKTATWLEAVSTLDGNGRHWNDYINSPKGLAGGDTSSDVYTSFDDGAIGIGDFFWQLYEKTKDPHHKAMALQTLAWTFSQAKSDGNGGYEWKWDVTDPGTAYYMGMGEGVVGLVHTFASYYERLKDSDPDIAAQCRHYIDGALKHIENASSYLGENGDSRTIPETGIPGQDGDTEMDSGYLSGGAGEAFMYLKLHQVFGGSEYLDKADKVFGYLEDSDNGPLVKVGADKITWKLAIDEEDDDTNRYATGMEEGSAGIGWVYLQAYNLTKQEKYLTRAKQAANWLLDVAIKGNNGGMSWREYELPNGKHSKAYIHANLNNGAAGIGMFLEDLHLAIGESDTKYRAGSEAALTGLVSTMQLKDGKHAYWKDNGGDGDTEGYQDDPSWHWGTAGILAFGVRMSGGKMDIPGEQPALVA